MDVINHRVNRWHADYPDCNPLPLEYQLVTGCDVINQRYQMCAGTEYVIVIMQLIVVATRNNNIIIICQKFYVSGPPIF